MKRLVFLTCSLAFVLGSSSALAQQTQDPAKLQQAKQLFIAGARAYTDGKYEVAVQAFEQANSVVPGAPVVFSIAQAYRKMFYLSKRPDALREALKRYREYVTLAPSGDRRPESELAIQELSIAEAKMPAEMAAAMPVTKKKTIVSISSSAEDALFSVDGGPATAIGESVVVAPGKHHLKVMATGYLDEERDITPSADQFFTLDVALKDRPAKLMIEGTSGAHVTLDGRDIGTTPLTSEIVPGTHLLTILKNGTRAYNEEIVFSRGKEKRMNIALETSSQRRAAWTAFGIGGVAVITGAVFTIAALNNESTAVALRDDPTAPARLGDYAQAKDRRDTFAMASYISYGVGAAAIGTGLVLFLFDAPTVSPPVRAESDQPKKNERNDSMMEKGISFLPTVTPTYAGGSVKLRF